MSELQTVAERVMSGTYWEVFPDPYALKVVYRRLAQVLHPDRYKGDERVLATTAFGQVTALREEAEQALAAGRYGQPQIVIRTRKAVHKIGKRFGTGDIADLYYADTTDGATQESLIKVARKARDNDLIAAEATALKKLHAEPDDLERHIPVLLDSFLYPQGRRRANAIRLLGGYTVEQVQRAYPDGVDPRHIAWMWRRLLVGLGYAHDLGVVHGAVLPPHVLIGPQNHAVMLLDWCYSSTETDGKYPPIKAMVNDWRHFYPEEILAKQAPSPATDIAMAAYTMAFLSGRTNPLRTFFKGCVLQKQRMRPQSAWELLREFDELLEQLGEPFHPRRWVEFAVPAGVA